MTRTRCIVISTCVITLLLLITPQLFAQTCLQQEYNQVNKQTLGCTANDVRVAKVINIRDPKTGTPITTCTPGTFSFLADFLVQTTSTSSRSNIGLYFQRDPTAADALTGSCADFILTQANDPSYEELDPQSTKKGPAPDNCGDTSATDPTVCLDASNNVVSCAGPHTQTFTGTQVVSVLVDNFQCPSGLPSGTQLSLPNCTSWQVPGSTIQCNSNDGTYQSATFNGGPAAIPGSPSKCNCGTIPLGITVQTPSVGLQKACELDSTTPDFTSTFPTKCTFPDASKEGGEVTYWVNVTNKSNFGGVIIDQVCDDKYGEVYNGTGTTGTCAKGTLCSTGAGTGCVNSTTCGSLGTISTSATCNFKVTQGESQDITNTVLVYGHGDSGGGTFGPTDPSNSVEVVSGENASTASITKGYNDTLAGCFTVRYNVVVHNSSPTDEDLTLTALNDSYFSDITATHAGDANGNGAVVATTCGLPAGGKSLPAGGSDFSCTFDGKFCEAFGTIVTAQGTCTAGTCAAGTSKAGNTCSASSDCNDTCQGIQNVNKVSGTFTGDEGETNQSFITVTNNTFTVNQCVTLSHSSTTP